LINQVKANPAFLMQRFSSIVDNDDTMSSSQSTKTEDPPPLNEDDDRKLKLIKLELSSLQAKGGKVPNPDLLKQIHWDELLDLKTKSARGRYYTYMFLQQMYRENLLLKRQKKSQIFEEFKAQQALEPPQEDQHIVYSLTKTNMLLRMSERRMNLWNNNKLTRAMQFGDKLIFDCSYDSHMNKREAINTAKQLMICFAMNRQHSQPFDLYFCNANFDCVTMKYLERSIPILRNKEFPLNVHEGSYLDLFPKEKLVYLTPHCNNDLTEYDPDSIYIIGAMVDKMNHEPHSLGKAKHLGLRMARLPLDRYLSWGAGSGKSLTLNQMTDIMLDLRQTRDWPYALRHVPKRKLFKQVAESIKGVKSWTAKVNKFKFPLDDQRMVDNTIPTADKFKTWVKVIPADDNTTSTANKFKKNMRMNKNDSSRTLSQRGAISEIFKN
jgi:ribonuclease P protein 1